MTTSTSQTSKPARRVPGKVAQPTASPSLSQSTSTAASSTKNDASKKKIVFEERPPHPAETGRASYIMRPQGKHTSRSSSSRTNNPTDHKPSSASQSTQSDPEPVMNEAGFNGVVDNRVIPDAGMPTEQLTGVLELMPAGFGYLRNSYSSSNKDVYVSSSQVRRFGLRVGDNVTGQARAPKDNERYWGLLKVEQINGVDVDAVGNRAIFDELTSEFPDQQIVMETDTETMSTRILDLISPIGKGQRGLIVSPPKAGKTWLLRDVDQAVATNYPEMELIAILIGERPEEVTYFRREIKGEVIGSNFDQTPIEQVRIAELALERAKRLVEMGKDVFILLDSITRLARAYNLAKKGSGRTMSGGFDAGAIFPAKKFLGAARKLEGNGSLTILGTALIDTGSRMDELIYEEFKGTGNMEIHLDRALAEMRIFPAINVMKSGTRQEELLYAKDIYPQIVVLRRMLGLLGDNERTQILIDKLSRYKTNLDFLKNVEKSDT